MSKARGLPIPKAIAIVKEFILADMLAGFPRHLYGKWDVVVDERSSCGVSIVAVDDEAREILASYLNSLGREEKSDE
jgi:hypothetical protein